MHVQPELQNSPKSLAITLFICFVAVSISACAPKTYSDRSSFSSLFAKKDVHQDGAFNPLKTLTPAGDAAAPPSVAYGDNILHKNLFEMAAQNSNRFCSASALKGNTPFDHLIRTAFTQLGKYYRSGGVDPGTGFDCSGFTSWVFAANGINLPRSSREQFLEGKVIDRNQLQSGDLVFFRKKKSISHVGIYLENGQFIHSSRKGDTVKISSLSEPIWEQQFAGARRIVNN
ncbi:MAG: C40 family peptidase [Desulfovibrionaceae bacterium]|nr:C40 family peptidase [Desulfovibrionaceae bacterium]MBF0512944.1 C40 family peptidase [Desulfovibrionaceae bacterium]